VTETFRHSTQGPGTGGYDETGFRPRHTPQVCAASPTIRDRPRYWRTWRWSAAVLADLRPCTLPPEPRSPELRSAGWTQASIADELGLSKGAVWWAYQPATAGAAGNGRPRARRPEPETDPQSVGLVVVAVPALRARPTPASPSYFLLVRVLLDGAYLYV